MGDIVSVRTGTLLPGARLLKEDCRNLIWKAPVKFPDGSTEMVYLKGFDSRMIFVELLCAFMGRMTGLPIPEPILVRVQPDLMSKLCEVDDEIDDETNSFGYHAFGSMDADYPSLNRLVSCDDNFIWEKLKKHSQSVEAAIFDEWIANSDRHWGNLLYDGSDGFIYIDHDLCLDKKKTADEPLDKNLLLEFLCRDLDELSKQRIVKESYSNKKSKYEKLDLFNCVQLCYGEKILDPTALTEIVAFLSRRLDVLEQLVKVQVSPVQKELFHVG